LDDAALDPLKSIAEELEVLSLCGLPRITDDGLIPLAAITRCMKLLNLSNCPQVSSESVFAFAKSNKRMHTLKVAAMTSLTDEGLSSLCLHMSPDFMTNVDISFCRDITDFGLATLSEVCPKLKTLNLCAVSRVTDVGIQRLLTNCWFLEDLNMEDIFLVDDKAFWFNSAFDGRPAANELMLKSMVTLNCKDCVNLNDHGLVGLSERCRKVEVLCLSGCEKITNTGLLSMSQNVGYQIPMCDSFKSLDLSYIAGQKAGPHRILGVLPSCGCQVLINHSGITSVDDGFIHQLCLVCKTVQGMCLQKCVQLTNLALCSMADFLWVEKLDISSCSKITDDGLEVLASACSGLLTLSLRKLNKVTARGLNAVSRSCHVIESVDVRDCVNITEQAILDLKHSHRLVKVQSNFTIDPKNAGKNLGKSRKSKKSAPAPEQTANAGGGGKKKGTVMKTKVHEYESESTKTFKK
jgi:hypothetical protein